MNLPPFRLERQVKIKELNDRLESEKVALGRSFGEALQENPLPISTGPDLTKWVAHRARNIGELNLLATEIESLKAGIRDSEQAAKQVWLFALSVLAGFGIMLLLYYVKVRHNPNTTDTDSGK